MMTLRPAAERGRADFGWLDSRHTFSFGSYHDPRHTGFGPLRVINDDRVAPGRGFGAHGHADMEIVSWPLEGALAHRDSTGHESVVEAGAVQRMSAGSGVTHSEFNASEREPVRFLQIWIVPDERGVTPRYDERRFTAEELDGRFARVVADESSAADDDRPLPIHRRGVAMHAARLDARHGETRLALEPGQAAWVQVARGTLSLNGQALVEGDGVAVVDERELRFDEARDAEVLVFTFAPEAMH